MADPFRLRTLKALTNTLKTISPSRGYINDLTDYAGEGGIMRPRVFRGVSQFGINDPLPLVSILEDPEPLPQTLGGRGANVAVGDWGLVLQGFVQDDPDNPTDPAHILAAEVIKALALEWQQRQGNLFGLGGQKPCIREFAYTNPVVRPADDHVSSVAFFYMNLTLRLVEDPADPFA